MTLRESEVMSSVVDVALPDARGHFGPYGGRYVPETLMHPLQELEDEYFRAQNDPEFKRELAYYLREFVGRPTPLYFAERLTRSGNGHFGLQALGLPIFSSSVFGGKSATKTTIYLFPAERPERLTINLKLQTEI